MKRKHPLIATNSLENLSPFSNQTLKPLPLGGVGVGITPLLQPLHPSKEGASPVFIGVLAPLHP